MTVDKTLAVMFSILILLNGYAVRRIVGTWVFPACLFALFWFGYTFLPLVVLTSLPINPWATGFIFLGTVAFSLSAFVRFRWRWAFAQNLRKPDVSAYFNTPFLRTLFFSSSILALLCFFINMRIQGFSIQDMLWNSIETAALYSSKRGSYDLTPNLFVKLDLGLSYLAATLGGLLYGAAASRRQAIAAVTFAFLPAIASLLLESAKGLVFQFLFLFVGCVLVTRVFQNEWRLISKSDLRRGLIALVILAPLTAVSFFSRGLFGVTDSSIVAEQMPRFFASYAFGHLYAFSDWFSYHLGMPSSMPYPAEAPGYGFYTFAPIFRIFGSTQNFLPGIYEDVFIGGDLLEGNIYTMFRGLIIDFGMAGTLLYMFVSGLLLHLSFYFLLAKRRPIASVAIFIYMVGYFYSSALISLFIYNVIPSSIIVLSACLYLNQLLSSLKGHTPLSAGSVTT